MRIGIQTEPGKDRERSIGRDKDIKREEEIVCKETSTELERCFERKLCDRIVQIPFVIWLEGYSDSDSAFFCHFPLCKLVNFAGVQSVHSTGDTD